MVPGSLPPVVLYHYEASPIARKVRNILAVKRIPHVRVEMPMTLPRPDLADRLGITYRRIPVLAIGRDVYCDSSLIASVLERRFPASDGFGTLFPKRKGSDRTDAAIIKQYTMSYADRVLGTVASFLLPYHKFKPEFLADRTAWFGQKLDPSAMQARQPLGKSWLSSHLALLEEQFADGREWLFDTETPSLADLSVHYVWEWLASFKPMQPAAKELLDATVFPATVSWISRMTEHTVKAHTAHKFSIQTVSGERAAEIITSSAFEDLSGIGFDETEGTRLGVQLSQLVSVTPDDNGKVPTVGRLLALNKEQVVIETEGSAGTVRCHFPRIYYVVQPAASAKL
ncbi:uncharacterized protein BXZ73DRAFT_102789 [Epithele typhae]|uniref:uncharacterized protein n=1 Tax=Epithele typhae TaxID=378194 RepID=UPI002007B043|nr:uncharacterized protein BXZ73DRAFT_102789 [Epithele typhae]KAH9927203.1 hypothetical protein BXZ73DRAFT_102789 [Epithele typhae]